MATTKKTKVVDWEKELDKATGKLNKSMDKLFKDFDKEVSKSAHPMSLSQRNALWNKKYEPKYDKLDKQIDAAYLKLWQKYFNKNNTPKEGIVFKK